MKYPNTKSWLFFWCSCFNFFNVLIFRCLFWRLILVCSLLVRVLSSITLHSRCHLSFNWSNVFSLFLIAGTILYDVFNHLSYDAWFFSTEFSVWLCSSSFSCERIWFSIKISIFTWCVCVSCFGYEAVIRTSLDAFSEVRLRWHHGCWNVLKSSSLACIYVHIFCAYVYPEFGFCDVFAVTCLCERVAVVDLVLDVHVISHLSGLKQWLQFSTETFSRICLVLIILLSMFSDVPVMSLPSRNEIP